jgi:hypothetical protein
MLHAPTRSGLADIIVPTFGGFPPNREMRCQANCLSTIHFSLLSVVSGIDIATSLRMRRTPSNGRASGWVSNVFLLIITEPCCIQKSARTGMVCDVLSNSASSLQALVFPKILQFTMYHQIVANYFALHSEMQFPQSDFIRYLLRGSKFTTLPSRARISETFLG